MLAKKLILNITEHYLLICTKSRCINIYKAITTNILKEIYQQQPNNSKNL